MFLLFYLFPRRKHKNSICKGIATDPPLILFLHAYFVKRRELLDPPLESADKANVRGVRDESIEYRRFVRHSNPKKTLKCYTLDRIIIFCIFGIPQWNLSLATTVLSFAKN